MMLRGLLSAVLMVLVVATAAVAADEVGQIKVSKGEVHIERNGKSLPAPVGAKVQLRDVVVTGADGSAGVTFLDNSLMSVGPGSALAIDRFAFDSTTNQGAFESSLKRGTLSVVSGKIAKQTPDAMKVRTPAAILGVRGTEFVVRTGEKD